MEQTNKLEQFKSFKLGLVLKFIIISSLLIIQGCNNESDEPSIEETNNNINYTASQNNISYYNGLIVFNFAENYTVGQYANGDYWVYNNGNDVIITQITPVSNNIAGRKINGTMINPEESSVQGYDSKSLDMTYNDNLNVDPGNTGIALLVHPGTSVVKSISMQSTAGRPIISDAVVLTVVNDIPEVGSFRPPYTGADKSVIATTNDLNFNALGNHPRLGSEPNINQVAQNHEKVWLEHCAEWTQRDIHPLNNMPTYGRDIAEKSAIGLILLQLNYTNDEKRELLINMVQYGIDLYGIVKNGAVFYNNGGHNLGRKMPILLAAKVLNNSDMLSYANKESHFIFQDDQQHFYVSAAEVALTNSSAWMPDTRATLLPYQTGDIGLPEWGIRHADRPAADNKSWDATYRNVNGYSQTSHVFAARLMGVKDDWNWPPVFDYTDRFYDIEEQNFPNYIVDLWEAYR